MSTAKKTLPKKRLVCPAYVTDKVPKEGGYRFISLQCPFFVDLTTGSVTDIKPIDEVDAEYRLLLHLKESHHSWWNRHGKKRVTAFSKKVTIRGRIHG